MIAVRSEREIDLLRQANQIVADVLVAMAGMVKPGVTTKELDTVAEEIIYLRGALPSFKGYHGYPAATCISVEEQVIHGIPGNRVLRAGQIVSMDVGVFYKGYHGDAAVTVACAEVDAARQKLMATTDLALTRAIKAARTGNFLSEVSKAVERTCKKEKYGVVRSFVGHGIGTEMHEEPQVPNFDTGQRGPVLKTGMILALEPMVNMGTHRVKVLQDGWTAVTADGKPSAHFEHSVVVREGAGEILSASGKLIWGRREDKV